MAPGAANELKNKSAANELKNKSRARDILPVEYRLKKVSGLKKVSSFLEVAPHSLL